MRKSGCGGDEAMLTQRARQIMDSKGVIDVHYQGRKVWLEELDGEQAIVSLIENPGNNMQVRINDLVEQ